MASLVFGEPDFNVGFFNVQIRIKMKSLLTSLTTAIVGGLVVLFGQHWLGNKTGEQAPEGVALVRQVKHKNLNVKAGSLTAPFNFREAAARTMPAVVHIEAEGKRAVAHRQPELNHPFRHFFGDDYFERFFQFPFDQRQFPMQGTGSGVIYSEAGHIITNYHVIDFAERITITLHDNRKYEARIVGSYPEADLAVLKIDAPDLTVIKMGDSDRSEVGDWVLAVGNPFDLSSTVTAGIVSAKGRDIGIIQGDAPIESFIQTDAVVNPGNSGGALVDLSGALIGINTAITTHTGVFEGYSFAIPVNIVLPIIEELIANGTYERGFLGVEVEELDAEYAEELQLPITQGVVIAELLPGSAAALSGLLPGDVIVAIDGQEIQSAPTAQDRLNQRKPGETVRLTIHRNARNFDVDVRLKAGR